MSGIDIPNLHTQRLLLRPIVAGDADALLTIFSNERVMRYWSTPPWSGAAEARRFIASSQQMAAQGLGVRLGIQSQADLQLLGQCALYDWMPGCRRAELGYSLADSAWGMGYAQEAVRALLQWGYDHLDLNRVEADIDPRNEASARLLQRLGFVKEGHLRERWVVSGEVSDTGLYGLLKRDWLLRAGAT